MKKENFVYRFSSSQTPEAVFSLLSDVKQWWSGLYGETIQGESSQLHDEFSFEAGGGMHYSAQELVERIPGKKIIWLVTDSKLSFLSDTGEWTQTKFGFEISKEGDTTQVTFTHDGLTPQIECYDQCSAGWTGYLDNLAKKLR